MSLMQITPASITSEGINKLIRAEMAHHKEIDKTLAAHIKLFDEMKGSLTAIAKEKALLQARLIASEGAIKEGTMADQANEKAANATIDALSKTIASLTAENAKLTSANAQMVSANQALSATITQLSYADTNGGYHI